MAKTLYHSELVTLSQNGPVKITVDSEVKKSKFPGKSNFIYLKLADQESRPYSFDNANCEAFFKGQAKGRTFSILADGKAEGASLTYVGEAAAAPSAQPSAPTSVAPPAAPPCAPSASVHAAPPAAPAPAGMSRESAMKGTKTFVGQRLSLMKVCARATLSFKKEWDALPDVKEAKLEMTREEFWGRVTSLYISAESQGLAMRSGFADAMPPHIELATLQPPKAAPSSGNATAPSQPQAIECPKCRQRVPSLMQSGMCPACDDKNDDIPF